MYPCSRSVEGAPLFTPANLVTTMPSLRTLATMPKPCGVLTGNPACSGVILCRGWGRPSSSWVVGGGNIFLGLIGGMILM